MEKLSATTIRDVVLNLIGKASPVGESYEDKRRYENLETMGVIFTALFEELSDIEYNNAKRVEWSMNNAGKRAGSIIEHTLSDYLYDRGYRKIEKDLWQK